MHIIRGAMHTWYLCISLAVTVSHSSMALSSFKQQPITQQQQYTTTIKLTRTTRRSVLFAPFLATASLVAPSSKAQAFDNAVPEAQKYADKPKRRGTPPKDLGLSIRTTEGENDTIKQLGLRTCDGNPNCFSSTGDFLLEDRVQRGVDFYINPWKPPVDESISTSFATLVKLVKAYEPGQGGIDGGGFTVVKETPSYLYCQFESLKKGYIDDVEFASSPNGSEVFVRSASRVGVSDFGVNAIRLNRVAKGLRKRGWVIDEITPESHRDYWMISDDAREATFDADRRVL